MGAMRTKSGAISAKVSRMCCRYGDSCYDANTLHWLQYAHPGDPDHPPIKAPSPTQVDTDMCRLPCDGSEGRTWVRESRNTEHRRLRRKAAGHTLSVCRATGYRLPCQGWVELHRISDLIAGTKLLTTFDVAVPQLSASSNRDNFICASPDVNAIAVAVDRAGKGERVALISAASAFHAGGGFRTGGRHAFEESLCVQSTIMLSLQRALWMSQQSCGAATSKSCDLRYIPLGGAVLSPWVEVFRDGIQDGYSFRSRPVTLDCVISVAMPNRNPAVQDSPVDCPDDPEEYRLLLRRTLMTALGAAQLQGATTLVIPALGCGVFQNDPTEIGQALGDVLASERFHGAFDAIVIAGAPPSMVDAAIKTCSQQVMPTSTPVPCKAEQLQGLREDRSVCAASSGRPYMQPHLQIGLNMHLGGSSCASGGNESKETQQLMELRAEEEVRRHPSAVRTQAFEICRKAGENWGSCSWQRRLELVKAISAGTDSLRTGGGGANSSSDHVSRHDPIASGPIRACEAPNLDEIFYDCLSGDESDNSIGATLEAERQAEVDLKAFSSDVKLQAARICSARGIAWGDCTWQRRLDFALEAKASISRASAPTARIFT